MLQYFVRPERLDLALALDNQGAAPRDLHTARAFGTRQLAPQYRRQGEAEQVIERTAGKVGRRSTADRVFARAGHRLGDRRLGDRVEGDAVDAGGQAFALLQQFQPRAS